MLPNEQKPKSEIATDMFAILTRDVDWQRASFLRYCLSIIESDVSTQGSEDVVVKKIAGGYFVLALLFYKQFRKDLKEKYDALPSYTPANEFDVKILIQGALNKLVDEWNRVYAIIVAIRARGANQASKRLVRQMDPFIDVATRDVALKDFPVILQYGQAYSLRFSNYSDNFAALSIPLWVLESPWEWTILWHELAGEKVRQLKLETPDFFTLRFDEIVNALQNEQAQILEAGWSVDWLEELFEDSFSVIHFPIHFLIVFKNLLDRFPDGGAGQRHPACSVRLAAALCLHLQMKNTHPDSTELPVISDWYAWDTWKELYDEGDENELKFRENLEEQLRKNSPLDFKAAWLMAGKICQWHHANHTDNNDPNEFREIIGNAIRRYSNFGYGEDNRDNIFQEAIAKIAALPIPPLAEQQVDDGEYALISKAITKKLSTLSLTDMELMLKAHPQVGRLLNNPEPLGFRELLDLPFSDVDFLEGDEFHPYKFDHSSTHYTITKNNLDNATREQYFKADRAILLPDEFKVVIMGKKENGTAFNDTYVTTQGKLDDMLDPAKGKKYIKKVP